MIKFENTEVVGWEAAIRGMRNPMNSHKKSDSGPAVNCGECGIIDRYGYCRPKEHDCTAYEWYYIGPNDHDLMMRLAAGGPVHAKYRRMIAVYVDITAPLYWWKEADTYAVGVVKNSCSTMHKIHAKEFTMEDFSCEHLTRQSKERLEDIIDDLNYYRTLYLNGGDDYISDRDCVTYAPKDKHVWWQMIQLLPTSYNQRRTVMMNYEVLAGIYPMRKNHKLDEWHDFCYWIKSLPYSELIIGEEKEK